MLNIFLSLSSFLLASANISGEVVESESNFGMHGTLTFVGSQVSMQTTSALLCSDSSAVLKKAVLWMPHMGHGSSPTRVTPYQQKAGCFVVDEIEFLMPGLWEVRAQFSDGDAATFSFQVLR